MKIWAMLSFFDEDPELLTASISRVCDLGIDVLCVCDGPYDLYPHEKIHSPINSWRAISRVAEERGIQWLGWSKGSWKKGNEVEKRNFMLDKVLDRTQEGDWLLVFDADHMWEQVDPSWPLKTIGERVERGGVVGAWNIEPQVAEVGFADCAIDENDPSWYQANLLYRAVPGMRYDGAHWRIRFPDGAVSTTLRTGQEEHTARTLDLREHFRVRHTVFNQSAARRENMGAYYVRRDEPGKEIER